MSELSIREKILAASDIKEEEVVIPDWGVTVLVRGMSAAQRVKFLEVAVKDRVRAHAFIFGECILDPATRKPIFEPADRDELMRKSSVALDAILIRIQMLSGTDPDAWAALEKNLKAGESDTLPSSSPDTSTVQ